MAMLILRIVKRILNFFKYNIYVNETLILFEHVSHTYPETSAKISNVTFENLRDVLNFQHPRYLPIFAQFMWRGDAGYFAYLDGCCVHRSWVVHTPQTVHLHAILPKQLEPGEAFIHYCETAPQARGRNIFPAVLSKIAEDFKNHHRTLMISANAKNKSSINGIKKAGFIERERERVMVLLGIKFIKRSSSSS